LLRRAVFKGATDGRLGIFGTHSRNAALHRKSAAAETAHESGCGFVLGEVVDVKRTRHDEQKAGIDERHRVSFL
jgi:hypothetical protein